MTGVQVSKLIDTAKNVGINQYAFTNDLNVRYYNDNKTCFVVDDPNLGGLHGFQKNGYGGSHTYFPHEKRCCHNLVDYDSLTQFMTAGTPEEIQQFVEALGLTLDSDQIKILKWMNESSSNIKPITGDYNFIPKSPKEVEKMEPEEREEYDKQLHAYELRKAGIDGKASISIEMG